MRTDVPVSRLVANPAARHPMRRMIRPPAPPVHDTAGQQPAANDDQDLKLFALSFTAFFICIYSLIY